MVVLDGVSLEEDNEAGSEKSDRMRNNTTSAGFVFLALDFMVAQERRYQELGGGL